jgi:cyclic pyranopterin phosphate synthase
MNDVELSIQQVLDGIEVAHSSGLDLKINCVIQRGVNEHAILPLVEYFRHTPHVLRFIEYMDVGNTNAWSLDEVVSVEEIIAKISAVYPLNPIPRTHVGDTASRYSFADGGGEIGVISSVSAPFCGNCNRARISADGQIYTCLFASSGFDLRERLRRGDSDDELAKFVSNIWSGRDDQYSQLRSNNIQTRDKIEMSYIGG